MLKLKRQYKYNTFEIDIDLINATSEIIIY